MPPRTSDQPKPLAGSFHPPEPDQAEEEFARLLERALAPSFTLVRRIGSGGMGAVYLARDPVRRVRHPELGTGGDPGQRCQRPRRALKIVPDQEWLPALSAEIVQALCLVAQTAGAAFEVSNIHGFSLSFTGSQG